VKSELIEGIVQGVMCPSTVGGANFGTGKETRSSGRREPGRHLCHIVLSMGILCGRLTAMSSYQVMKREKDSEMQALQCRIEDLQAQNKVRLLSGVLIIMLALSFCK